MCQKEFKFTQVSEIAEARKNYIEEKFKSQLRYFRDLIEEKIGRDIIRGNSAATPIVLETPDWAGRDISSIIMGSGPVDDRILNKVSEELRAAGYFVYIYVAPHLFVHDTTILIVSTTVKTLDKPTLFQRLTNTKRTLTELK